MQSAYGQDCHYLFKCNPVKKMNKGFKFLSQFDCSPCQVMELKGQMIHVPESCSLMFLGSPRVDKLEELMGRGLHLSDIPIHDATRDVILVGEQAKAQDGLKKRMDKLKVEWLLYSVSLVFTLQDN